MAEPRTPEAGGDPAPPAPPAVGEGGPPVVGARRAWGIWNRSSSTDREAIACQNRPVPNRRPRLQIVAPSASPEEAAAVVAAVERFLRDTAPPPAPVQPPPDPWVRAARLEAVDRFPQPDPWR